jgi:hypothetical protein
MFCSSSRGRAAALSACLLSTVACTSYTDEVRTAEREWQQAGIQSVPAVVIDRRHLISGGQPAEVEVALEHPVRAEHPEAGEAPGGGVVRGRVGDVRLDDGAGGVALGGLEFGRCWKERSSIAS